MPTRSARAPSNGHRRILLGFVAGAALGLGLHALCWPEPPAWINAFLNYGAEPVGRLFLRLLLLSVLPLVVSSLILGVAEMGNAARLGRVALKTLACTLVITGISVLTGLAFVKAFEPGKDFPAAVRDAMVSQGKMPAVPPLEDLTFVQRLLLLVPDNPIKAAATGDFLGVMFFSMLFAVGVIRAD